MQREWDKALDLIYGRMNDCIWDIRENIPIDVVHQIRELKLDLIIWALEENNNNATHASKLLNLNRTTMVSMLHNELSSAIEKRKKEKK